AVMWAASGGSESAYLQLSYREDVRNNRESTDGWTSLTLAARHGHGTIVQHILKEEKDADIDCGSWLVGSPMILASRYGHDNVVQLLMEWGIDINKADVRGQTPL